MIAEFTLLPAIDLITAALLLLAGLGLGLLFYGSLWLSLARILGSARPALWLPLCFIVRMAVILAGFYWLSDSRWQNLLPCLSGFVLGRIVLLRITRNRPQPGLARLEELTHAAES